MIPTISVYLPTYNTTSSKFAITPIFIRFWKGMSTETMYLASIYRWWAITTKSISSLRTKNDMVRIATRTIVANYMIKNWGSVANTLRDWFNKISIHKSVNHLCLASKIKHTITSIFNFCTRPVPTLSFMIDGYFRKKTLQFIVRKNNFKVFSHV
jgi:hypothetical protein